MSSSSNPSVAESPSVDDGEGKEYDSFLFISMLDNNDCFCSYIRKHAVYYLSFNRRDDEWEIL